MNVKCDMVRFQDSEDLQPFELDGKVPNGGIRQNLMNNYSLRSNLLVMVCTLVNPGRLIRQIPSVLSLLYGVIPLLLYLVTCEIGWISAYTSQVYEAINPLPKYSANP